MKLIYRDLELGPIKNRFIY